MRQFQIEEVMNDIESLKKYGIIWPVSDLIKSIGWRYYILFWKRKYLMQNEILRRVETCPDNSK